MLSETMVFKSSYGVARWSMEHCRKVFDKETEMKLKRGFCGAFFSLSGEFTYNMQGMGNGTVKGLHYGIVNIPRNSCKLVTLTGWYDIFLVRAEPAFFKTLVQNFPALAEFVTKAECNMPASLISSPMVATPEMMSIVYTITGGTYHYMGKKTRRHLSVVQRSNAVVTMRTRTFTQNEDKSKMIEIKQNPRYLEY